MVHHRSRLVLVGGGSQSQNRCSPVAHDDGTKLIAIRVADIESVVTVLEDGFDEDFAVEDEVMSEGREGEGESEVEVPFRLPGAWTLRRTFGDLDGVNLVEEFDERVSSADRIAFP